MAPTTTTSTGNGSADPLAARHPRPDTIHIDVTDPASSTARAMARRSAAAHAPALSGARRAARTLAAWARGPLTRAARRGADIALLALGLATIAIGIGLAYRPAGIVFAGLAIIYIQIWLAAAPPAPPAPRRIDQE